MNLKNILPYLSLGTITFLLFSSTRFIPNNDSRGIILGLVSNGLFVFILFLFFDRVKQNRGKEETGYIHQGIRQQISSSIFNYLYFVKKIIYGYNLNTDTYQNIIDIAKLNKKEIKNLIVSQRHLGFQIFKSSSEVKKSFSVISKNNIFLKFSSPLDSVWLLKVANNLADLEMIYQNKENFNLCVDKGVEFEVLNGSILNSKNDDKLLLIKSTTDKSIFVIYDSGYFEKYTHKLLLNQYVLKPEIAERISDITQENLMLMLNFLSEKSGTFPPNDFRFINDYCYRKTNITNRKGIDLFIADRLKCKK